MKNNKILKKVENVTVFLFVFNMINREFTFFGVDIRGIVLLLSLAVMFYQKLIIREKIKTSSIQKYIGLLYIFIIVTTLYNWSNEYLVHLEQIKLLVLYTYNYILIFFVSSRRYELEYIADVVLISTMVLIFSLILSYLVNGTLMFTDIEGIYYGSHMSNFYGLDFRLSGFAQDPNYASLSIVIAIVMTVFTKYRKQIKISILILLVVFYGFTASKTILLGSVIALVISIMVYKFSNYNKISFRKKVMTKQFFFISLLVVFTLFPILLVEFNIDELIFSNSSSMTQRFSMWRNSLELFHQSPIIGNGLGSARSYYSVISRLTQIHSTPFQLFAEFGIIGFTMYTIINVKLLNTKNMFSFYVTILYIIFGLTYETMYLQFVPFVILLYFVRINYEENVDIVFINSLSGGGAEVVASNLISNLSKINDVIVFTLDDKGLKFDNTEIIHLSKRNIIYNYLLINSTVDYVNEDLIISSSSHLFLSHIYTSLSSLRFKSVYYFHGTIDSSSQSRLMKFLYRVVYLGKKLVFLNGDIKDEFAKVFRLNNKKRYIVKNFIDFSFIDLRSNYSFDKPNKKYFLFIGRLEDIKDPMFALKVYQKLIDNYDYDMYVLGTGSLYVEMVKWVKDNGLEGRINIVGFAENPYVWIKHAEVVFVTSKFESDSLVIMESLHLGTKVVAINCNYGPKYIMTNDLSEFLIAERDIDLFSEKVERAIINYPSNIDYIYNGRSIDDYVMSLRNLYKC